MTQPNMTSLLQEAGNPDQRNADLWAQCFVEADGDEGKAKALYVKRKLPAPTAPTPPPATTHGWCPNCSNECKLDASTCQKCGASFGPGGWQVSPYKPAAKPSPAPAEPEEKPKKGGIWKWVFGVPVGAFVLLMIIGSCAGNSPEAQERAKARDAISYCWKEQSRKSFSDSMAQFVAGACERMEADFKQKWGYSP